MLIILTLTFGIGLIPLAFCAFEEYREGISVLRNRFSDKYEKLGRPHGMEWKRFSKVDDPIVDSYLIGELLFRIPKKFPEDSELLEKMKMCQLLLRIVYVSVVVLVVAWIVYVL